MVITLILLFISLGLLYSIYKSRSYKHSLFTRLGVPGPKPNFIFGNLHSIAGKKFVDALQDWTTEYGSVYGYYEGSAPVLVTSDPEILKEVFIKQFHNFHGRRLLPVQPEPDTGDDKDVHMLFSRGHRWKRLRSTISPSFSKSKIKQMLPLIKCCIDETMTILEKKSEEGLAFDIHRVLQGLTIDVIGTCAFGLQPHFQKNRDNDPFIKRCQRLFTDFAKRPFILVLGAIFPELSHIWWRLCKLVSAYTYDDMDWLFTNLGAVIDERKLLTSSTSSDRQSKTLSSSASSRPVDLLQILLDAEVGSGVSSHRNSTSSPPLQLVTEEDYNCNYTASVDGNVLPDSRSNYLRSKLEQVFSQQHQEEEGEKWACPEAGVASPSDDTRSRLSIDEVKANSVVFLIAGYETLSNLLAYVTYEMARNPHYQRLLQQELDEAFPQQVELCYDKLTKLKYLDMVISETLRMYPIASLLTGRLCMKTTQVHGMTIPQGTMVQPDVWSLHYSADHWGPEDPHSFNPERFTPENKACRHPLVYMPFGAGPKNCVGMRFALTECKMTLARLFKRFNVEMTEHTTCELIETATLSPKDGITVKLLSRDSPLSSPGRS